MLQSKIKQIFYGTIFLGIFILIIGAIYFVFKSEPSCFDNKKNQGEEGIDCGGPCQKICLPENFRNIEVLETKFINVSNNLILLAKIQNPNREIAAQNFDYNFNLFDQNNNLIKNVSGSSFIYAEEIKYIIEFIEDNNLSKQIKNINLEIKNPNFVKAESFKKPNLKILNQDKKQINENTIQISGKIINNDFIEFNNVKIVTNFYKNNDWIGSSQTIINSILPQEIKDFKINFISTEISSYETFIQVKR
jgi:hypothetical protein